MKRRKEVDRPDTHVLIMIVSTLSPYARTISFWAGALPMIHPLSRPGTKTHNEKFPISTLKTVPELDFSAGLYLSQSHLV